MKRDSDYCPGNLHLNVIANAYTAEVQTALEPFIYELVGAWRDQAWTANV